MKNEERLSKKLGCGESHEEDEAGRQSWCAIFSTRKIEEDFTMISFQYLKIVSGFQFRYQNSEFCFAQNYPQ